ncbi:hypothetical protein PR048_022444 [Dryococelus australis]|uniref:Uncharacterized protein n=1 Tax=Dryococelus australis TaxID=614101 RepID=A0ABQ9H105_9NEOP|nr:hypothetical protein PR048_022444 [Dryococelus australis]
MRNLVQRRTSLECVCGMGGRECVVPDELKDTMNVVAWSPLKHFRLVECELNLGGTCDSRAEHLPRREHGARAATFRHTGRRTAEPLPTRATARLPPRLTGFNPRECQPRIFASGTRSELCRWLADFLGNLSFTPQFHSSAATFSPHFTLIGSQDLVVKSRPNLPTQHKSRHRLGKVTEFQRRGGASDDAVCFTDRLRAQASFPIGCRVWRKFPC